jgi:hypothetical protein|nr:MAG TPA: hypothetical protein [Caudoviricetes sp.]
MELVQEVYEKLKERELEWPDHAVVVVRDADGDIKFSSVGKYDIVLNPTGRVYMRGEFCLFNNHILPEPRLGFGTAEAMDIVTRSEYEVFYFTKEDN